MASIEFIQKRITGKEKELEKLTKKLERIRKAEAGNWETNNPYYYGECDLKWCLKDIETVSKEIENYKIQLAAEIEKANSRDVKVILEFLEMWKDRVRKFYTSGLIEYYAEVQEVKAAFRAANGLGWGSLEYNEARKKAEEVSKKHYINCHGVWENQTVFNYRRNREEIVCVKVADGKFEYLAHYTNQENLEAATTNLESDLVQEANRKYDFIIERTNRIVGQITDASGLKIGEKDDLNGYIIGTKGTAHVKTIGAGGYNIQCFHFRTLINEVK